MLKRSETHESFHGIALALRRLASLGDREREMLVTSLTTAHDGSGEGFTVTLAGPMPPWCREALNQKRKELYEVKKP